MDSVAINKNGYSPLKSEFAMIDAVADVPSLLKNIAHLQTIGASPAFSFYVSQDDKINNIVNKLKIRYLSSCEKLILKKN